MPLVIETTNTSGLTLKAIVDKVDTDGADVSPAQRWNEATGAFADTSGISPASDAYITLTEGTGVLLGYYKATVADIDGLIEKLRITIIDTVNSRALGVSNSIPVENFVAPEVVVDFTVTESR